MPINIQMVMPFVPQPFINLLIIKIAKEKKKIQDQKKIEKRRPPLFAPNIDNAKRNKAVGIPTRYKTIQNNLISFFKTKLIILTNKF